MTLSTRPKRTSKEVQDAVIQFLVKDFQRWMGNDSKDYEDDEVAAALKHSVEYGKDGFNICMALDSKLCISPDADLVEKMERAGDYAITVHTDLVKNWVIANDITAQFPVGSKVYVPSKNVVGEVTYIYADRAQYRVFVESFGHVREGLGTHGLVLDYEAVEAIHEVHANGV